MNVSAKQLTSQRFWDHMDRLDDQAIRSIEEALTKRLVEQFKLDLSCLVYDATNFYTWIDTLSEEELAQRGHNKAKRDDLKQVGLAMMVTTDFHIPLFHQLYAGNRTDSKQFSGVISDLAERYKAISQACENVTLVFDKGNNSKKNLPAVEATPFHFVGSLTPSHHSDLLAIAKDHYKPVVDPRLGGVLAYRTTKDVFGVLRTIVVTYNESLYLGQQQGWLAQRKKANEALRALQAKVMTAFEKGKRGKKPTKDSIEQHIAGIIKQRKLKKEWLRYDIIEREPGFSLTYQWNHEALAQHEQLVLGKTILFTDQAEWSNEQIILTYRGQSKIEDAFKKMKNPHFLSWNPRYHRTDQKIKVHAFYCVLALTLVSLMQRELHVQGMPVSTAEMLDELSAIKEVAHIYHEDSGIKPHITLTRLTDRQAELVKKLEIESYRSDSVGNTK
jgi:transposase